MPTVEQVWRQAMPRGTELVGGEPGVYNGVSWVVTLRPTPPGFDRLRGNELALIDVATVKGLGSTLLFLMTSLAEQGVGALGILGEVEPGVKETAQKYKIPVFHLPHGIDLGALENRITALINEERSTLYQREQELTQKLMELALGGHSATAILGSLQELSGRTVLLLNQNFEPVSTPQDPKLGGVQKTISRAFPAPPAAITGLKLGHGLSGFLNPVSGKPGTKGYILVVAPSEKLQEADRITAKAGALAVSVEMSRRQAVVDTEDKFLAEMLASILETELPAQALNEKARKLGVDPSQSYVTITAQVSGQKTDAAVKKIKQVLRESLCYPRGDILAIIHPVKPSETITELRRISKEIAGKLSRQLGAPVSLGIGRTFTGAPGLRISFYEAERALAVGRQLFGEGSVNLFGDLGVYRLLLSVNPDEVRGFYQASLGQLVEYDQKHGGEMLHTLEALLHYPTLAETAKAICVHRNTLLYRLQRIQEITRLNLEDGETRLMLHLALKAQDVIRAI